MRRILSLKDAYMLITGNIIGIGIFTTTGYISNYVASPILMLGLWILGGFIAFCGALTYAELATRFPRAGGDFLYLSRAYHPLVGFLFGWSALLVTYTGSIAVITLGFGYYFLNFFPPDFRQLSWYIPFLSIDLSLVKIVAISATIVFTAINVRGVKLGAQWQKIFTIGSILVLLLYIMVGFFSTRGNWLNLQAIPFDFTRISAPDLGQALIGIYFTFDSMDVFFFTLDYKINLPP